MRQLSIISWSFPILFSAQVIALLPNAVIMNAVSALVNQWCAEDEKGKGTAFCSLAITIGAILGLAVSGVIAGGMDPNDPIQC